MLEEVEVTQLFDLRIVDRVLPWDLWMGKAGAWGEIDGQLSPAGVEIDGSHKAWGLDAQGRLKQLAGHKLCCRPPGQPPRRRNTSVTHQRWRTTRPPPIILWMAVVKTKTIRRQREPRLHVVSEAPPATARHQTTFEPLPANQRLFANVEEWS
jgi:hypothetical protein